MSRNRFQSRFFTHLAAVILSFGLLAAVYSAMPILNGEPTPDVIFRLSLGSGYVALILLCLSLAFGVWRVLRRNKKPAVHFDLRRDVGIWAGVFAIIHTVFGLLVHFRGKGILIYFFYPSEQNAVIPVRLDAFGFANHIGLFAFLIAALLLVISNDFSLRKLGSRRWKNVQRLNYAFFALVLVHAVLYMVIEKRSLLFVILSILLFGSVLILQITGFVRFRRANSVRDMISST